jgi:hypothetical protein
VKFARVMLLVFGALCSQLLRAQAVDFEQLQRAIVVTLVTDEDLASARLGARSVRLLYPNDTQLTDLMAERLLDLTSAEVTTKAAIQATRWHLQSLGELRNQSVSSVQRCRTSRSKRCWVSRC